MRQAFVTNLLDWTRIWSPVAPIAGRCTAWAARGLPEPCALWHHEFVAAFVVAAPQPRVPLLLHAALGRDAGAVREEWLRIATALELAWGELRLPPDHLAIAVEILAVALAWHEDVLVAGILDRYLLPWVRIADERCAAGTLPAMLVAGFSEALAAAVDCCP